MRITQYTDYSLRVLIYLGLKNETATIAEISKAFNLSKNHLMKVVHGLAQQGYIKSLQGKKGGIKLAFEPSKIRIGEVVKSFEPMVLLECFDVHTNTCPIQGACRLEKSLYQAREVFIDHLNKYSLQDYLTPGLDTEERKRRLGLIAQSPKSA